LIEVDDEAAVRAVAPDFGALRTVAARGIIVTSRASNARDCDFVSRFFAPASGVDEDPVTGSAHCCLCPYWSARLQRQQLMARQLSARGGVLKLELMGARVLISGRAVTVLRGDLLA